MNELLKKIKDMENQFKQIEKKVDAIKGNNIEMEKEHQ